MSASSHASGNANATSATAGADPGDNRPRRIRKRRIRLRDARRHGPKIDARKLNWTLSFLALSALPFLVHLPIWPIALVLAAALWRWQLRRRNGKIPHALVRYGLTIVMATVVLATFGTFNGIEPGSSLLLVMAAMKLLESVAVRDLLVTIYMSFFMILASFLFDQSLISTLIALALVWMGITTLVQVNRDTAPEPAGDVVGKTGRMLAQSLPLLLLLFILFPRIPGPFWALPTTDTGMTGLSDNMTPGSISDLLQSSEIAFRAYFSGPQPERNQLYWRGPVLEVIKDRKWTRRTVQTAPSEVQLRGPAFDYTMVLEPHQSTWLLGLEFVHQESLPRYSELGITGELRSRKIVTERLRLQLRSHPDYTFAPTLDAAQRSLNLDTSATDNPQTRTLAESWRNTLLPEQVVDAALDFFNSEPFVYSLTDVKIPGPNSTDTFLFDKRRGFCEHYASSFALLMRYAGLPARVVTGYMGGEVNGITGHTTVRQSDAHAWTEVWLQGRGWVRVDPTAAVAPERVEQGVADALPDGEFLPALMMSSSGIMTGLRQAMDAINANWNNWVLGYSDERQWSLLSRLGLKKRSLVTLVGVLVACISITLLLLTLWLRHTSRYKSSDPVQRTYHVFQRRLQRLGVDTNHSEDALKFGRRAGRMLPDHAEAIIRFCEIYRHARYTRTPPPDAMKTLKALLRKIPRWPGLIRRRTA